MMEKAEKEVKIGCVREGLHSDELYSVSSPQLKNGGILGGIEARPAQ